MTPDLTHSQQMELTRLLLAKLEPEVCWHEWKENYHRSGDYTYAYCIHCNITKKVWTDPNPNLFADWEGFGRVFQAVNKRGDFEQTFIYDVMFGSHKIKRSLIATPDFQLAILQWLYENNPEVVERVLKGGGE